MSYTIDDLDDTPDEKGYTNESGKNDQFVPVSIRVLKEYKDNTNSMGIAVSAVTAIVTAVVSITSAIIGAKSRQKLIEAEKRRAEVLNSIQGHILKMVQSYNLKVSERRLSITNMANTLSGLTLGESDLKKYWVKNGGIVNSGYTEMLKTSYSVSLSGDDSGNEVYQGNPSSGYDQLQFANGSASAELASIHRMNISDYKSTIDRIPDLVEKSKQSYIEKNGKAPSSAMLGAMGRGIAGGQNKKYSSTVYPRLEKFTRQCEIYGIGLVFYCPQTSALSQKNDTLRDFVNFNINVKKHNLSNTLHTMEVAILYANSKMNDFTIEKAGKDRRITFEAGDTKYKQFVSMMLRNARGVDKPIMKADINGNLVWNVSLNTESGTSGEVIYEIGKRLQQHQYNSHDQLVWAMMAGVPYWCVYSYFKIKDPTDHGKVRGLEDTKFLETQMRQLIKVATVPKITDPKNSGGEVIEQNTDDDNKAIKEAGQIAKKQANSILGKIQKFWASPTNKKKTYIGLGAGLGAYLIGKK